MNLEFFLNNVDEVGSFFGLPPAFWLGYYYWCGFLDYPVVLEKFIRKGKAWPYLPLFWKGKKRTLIRMASLLIFWLGNLTSACALYYLLPDFQYKHFVALVIGIGLSVFVQKKIRYYGTDKMIHLQRDRYFQIYTKLANLALSKGDEISDSELLAKAQWQQHNDLRLADKQGRLLAFLRGEAKL